LVGSFAIDDAQFDALISI